MKRGLLLLALAAGPAWAEGDADHGARVIRNCYACHSIEPGVDKAGPSLHGVVGRGVGSEPRYSYSAAMRALGAEGAVWDEERLRDFLLAPRQAVPGTKMLNSGLRNPDDIDDLIAFLRERASE
ncbi:c-type cytochrome [Falsirhodobacter halotolerans]|uniref:c-type cytochrome n=1 Tax=Falsirhodobacter halotolerans TaxID=1146892 RepID=UPI001FD1731B|nr:cytochrome c family protein [Falsirhodobacter halotolerans]MCJ8139909.1 cytochrome c family protein [Falsirhodobacter halotolerans]